MGSTRSADHAVHRTNMAAARVTVPAAQGRAQQCLLLTSGLPQPSTQVLRRRPAANLPLCREQAAWPGCCHKATAARHCSGTPGACTLGVVLCLSSGLLLCARTYA